MRPIRLLTGVLTLSLVSSVVLGNFFHDQKGAEVQESHHLTAHVDSIDAHVHSTDADATSVALDSDAGDGECHITTAQTAIISSVGQRLSLMEAVGMMPIVFTGGGECQEHTSRLFTGREVPLFEHASLFAATISMRV